MSEKRKPQRKADESGHVDELCQALAGKYMTFRLADEEYGLRILAVREIIGLLDITRVPRTPDFIRGVINLRGKVIPVIDVRSKFGMGVTPSTDQTVIIVVQVASGDGEITMGILVDEVLEVVDVAADQVEPPPDFGSSAVDTDFLLGLGKLEHRVILILDIAKVLDAQESAQVRRVAAAGA